jgi:hypothetical protein
MSFLRLVHRPDTFLPADAEFTVKIQVVSVVSRFSCRRRGPTHLQYHFVHHYYLFREKERDRTNTSD